MLIIRPFSAAGTRAMTDFNVLYTCSGAAVCALTTVAFFASIVFSGSDRAADPV